MPQSSASSQGARSRSVTTNPWAEVIVITNLGGSPTDGYKTINATKLCMSARLNQVEHGTCSFQFTMANPSGMLRKMISIDDTVIVSGGRDHDEANQMFVGRITNQTPVTYYRDDPVTYTAFDSLHKLTRVYYDPYLQEVQQELMLMPDEFLHYLLTDKDYGGYEEEDVWVAKLPKAIEERWLESQQRSSQVNDNTSGGADSSGGGDDATGVRWSGWINKYAREFGHDPALIAAIIETESSFTVSRQPNEAGAVGPMQLVSEGYKNWMKQYQRQSLSFVEANIRAGCRALKDKIDGAGGDIWQGVRNYNGSGPAAEAYKNLVKQRYEKYKGIFHTGSGSSSGRNKQNNSSSRSNRGNQQTVPGRGRAVGSSASQTTAVTNQRYSGSTADRAYVSRNTANVPNTRVRGYDPVSTPDNPTSLNFTYTGRKPGQGPTARAGRAIDTTNNAPRTVRDSSGQTVPSNTNKRSKREILAYIKRKGIKGSDGTNQSDLESTKLDGRLVGFMAYCADNGWKLNITCVKTEHNTNTSSGNRSNHADWKAIDIGSVTRNGKTAVLIGSGQNSWLAESFKKFTLSAPKSIRPTEVISFDDSNGWMAMSDHGDHFHVAFDGDPVQNVPIYGNGDNGGSTADLIDDASSPQGWDEPWETDARYAMWDDVPLLNYALQIAETGFMKLTTNPFGQVIANIPNYIGPNTYYVSNFELRRIDVKPLNIDDLVTNVYVWGSPNFWQATQFAESYTAQRTGSSLITDEWNFGLLQLDPMFLDYKRDLEHLEDQNMKADEARQKILDSWRNDAFKDSAKNKNLRGHGAAEYYQDAVQKVIRKQLKAQGDTTKVMQGIVDRFGRRIETKYIPFLSEPAQLDLAADYWFREYWFKRWSASASCTFLPTMRPQHRPFFNSIDMSFYVTSVSHTMFDSWTTSMELTAGRPDNAKNYWEPPKTNGNDQNSILGVEEFDPEDPDVKARPSYNISSFGDSGSGSSNPSDGGTTSDGPTTGRYHRAGTRLEKGTTYTVGASTYGWTAGDDNGLDVLGKSLFEGKPAVAELAGRFNMSISGGGKDYMQKVRVCYKGRCTTAYFRDVGGGGGDVKGRPREIDLHVKVAKAIGFPNSLDLVQITLL